jgi:hypothetical protein
MKRLLVDYGDDVDFGEIVAFCDANGLERLSEIEVRDMVADWMVPREDGTHTFVVKCDDGKYRLYDFCEDFKIVDGDGKVEQY